MASGQLRAGVAYVYLEVEDDGAGMDEATRERMFDPFFTTKFLGRGLGMAAVHGIIRKHRGAMRVTSRPSPGHLRTRVPAVRRGCHHVGEQPGATR